MVYKAMLSAIAVLSSTTAMAQVAPPLAAAPSGDQPVAQQAGGLEDIVVTARRRSESSQNIPVAVTAFSAEQIDRQNLSSLEKVGAYTPQLTIARSATGSGAQITLRGIGSNPGSIGIEPSVAVIMDGVYFAIGRASYRERRCEEV